jgi:hypothetical protein
MTFSCGTAKRGTLAPFWGERLHDRGETAPALAKTYSMPRAPSQKDIGFGRHAVEVLLSVTSCPSVGSAFSGKPAPALIRGYRFPQKMRPMKKPDNARCNLMKRA